MHDPQSSPADELLRRATIRNVSRHHSAEYAASLAILRNALLEQHIAPPLVAKLVAYCDVLLEANQHQNLTGARDPEALLPHLLDSLSLTRDIQKPYIDLGSGGGLPAFPLALVLGIPCTLLEATAKKTRFLAYAATKLDVQATILTGRAEQLAFLEEHRERYLCGTARAVAITPTVLELLLPFIAVGGRAILQRGSFDERERNATADAALMLGGELIEERILDERRRVLIIQKTKPTQIRFPRRTGIPAKHPLCLD